MRFLIALILCILWSCPHGCAEDSDHYGTDFGQLYDPRFDSSPPNSAGHPVTAPNSISNMWPVFRPGSGLNFPSVVPGFSPGSELRFPDTLPGFGPTIGPSFVPDSAADPAPAFGKESASGPSSKSDPAVGLSQELNSDAKSTLSANDWTEYLRICEKRIAQSWNDYSVHTYKLPEHFRKHIKGVLSFELNSAGKISKMKVRHSSEESLRVAVLRRYPSRADGLLKAMDNSMIDAVESSMPLPVPPRKLRCPRRFVVVFDADRFNPLRMYVDDKIPVYASSMPQALIWKRPF